MSENIGVLFMSDYIVGIRALQRRLRALAKKNRKEAGQASTDGERFQIEGQADAYDFTADGIDKMMWGQNWP